MQYIPLSNNFMLVSFVGLFISIWLTADSVIDLKWGFTFTVMFIFFLIASVHSITPENDLKVNQ